VSLGVFVVKNFCRVLSPAPDHVNMAKLSLCEGSVFSAVLSRYSHVTLLPLSQRNFAIDSQYL
jgi:hypothetical protein